MERHEAATIETRAPLATGRYNDGIDRELWTAEAFERARHDATHEAWCDAEEQARDTANYDNLPESPYRRFYPADVYESFHYFEIGDYTIVELKLTREEALRRHIERGDSTQSTAI